MAGRNQHTIPQFLLKGFASRKQRGRTYVWLYRKGDTAAEVNTRNVSGERDFYGADLDARITALETDYAGLVDTLRANCSAGPRQESRIAEMVAHLTLRTRAVRESAVRVTHSMVEGVREHLSRPEVLKSALARHYGTPQILAVMRERLTTVGFMPSQIENLLPTLSSLVLPKVNDFMDELVSGAAMEVDKSLRAAGGELPISIRTSFIEALGNNLQGSKRVQWYAKFNWFVVSTAEPMLLGDFACLFEVDGARRFKPIDEHVDEIKCVYLPLAAHCVLVGTNTLQSPEIDVSVLNQATVSCSLEFFVSSRKLVDGSAALIKCIGDSAGILTNDDMRGLLDEFKREFPYEEGSPSKT